MSLQAGGTLAGRAILDQSKHDIWTAIYSIALQSYLTNGHGDAVAAAISEQWTGLLSDNGRREQNRQEFLLSDSKRIVWAYATDLAAFNVGVNASRIGQRLGVANSVWAPDASTWVEVFETAKEAAMRQATRNAIEMEMGLVEAEEGVDKFLESMKVSAVVAALSALRAVRDRTTTEESYTAGDSKKGGLSRARDSLKKWIGGE